MESTMIFDATMTRDLIKIIADKLAIGLLGRHWKTQPTCAKTGL
jgi:hypothetical protein